MRRIVLKITGQVQGVFFRMQTREEADKLGLVGWVRNEADGSVTIVAEGDNDRLKNFIEWSKIGSNQAAVENIEVEWTEGTGEFEKFEIKL